MRIGIMQGRLLSPEPGRVQAFPRTRWQQEFALAAAVGFEFIEWIYDLYGEDVNPLASDEGIRCMRRLALEHGIQLVSLCADYFKDLGILDPAKLVWLLERCRLAGVSRVVLPLLEAADVQTPELTKRVITVLRDVLPEAAHNRVEIDLETALAPAPFAALLDALPLKVNYDSGNSASQGYSLTEEFAAYGNRIGAIHIKDKLLNGASVPLGTGAVEFAALFRSLSQLDYRGDFVLEVARETPGQEFSLAQRNLAWLRSRL